MTDKLTGHAVRLAKRLNEENDELKQRIAELEEDLRIEKHLTIKHEERHAEQRVLISKLNARIAELEGCVFASELMQKSLTTHGKDHLARIARAPELLAENEELRKAVHGLLNYYRSDGCTHPDCGICRKSKASVANAYKALGEQVMTTPKTPSS